MEFQDHETGANTRVACVSSLFGPPNDAVNTAILGTLEKYLDDYRPHLRTFKEDDTGKPRSFGDRERDYARRRLSKPGRSLFVHATGSASLTRADSWQTFAHFVREDDGLSGIEWAVPVDTPPDTMRETFLRAAGDARYLHGNAGYGIVLPIDRVSRQAEGSTSIALASRFAGLDVVDVVCMSLDGEAGIKCVNWLTLVDDSLLAKLGGRDVVARRFGPQIICHALSSGLVIQAGPRPLAGDRNRPDELAPYREVAAVLRPIFAPTLYLEGLRDPKHDMLRTTTAWRNRFFEGAKWP